MFWFRKRRQSSPSIASRHHPFGESDEDVSPAALDELVAEIGSGDDEHFGVSVKHESEWCLTAYPSGNLVWENVEAEPGTPRHCADLTVQQIRDLFGLLANGQVGEVEAAVEWKPGYYDR